MAHQIENRNGIWSTMYAGAPPWHKLGQAVDKEVTSAAAMKLAGIDWKVEKHPIYLQGKHVVDGIPVVGEKITTHEAVCRVTDKRLLGIVGASYEPIQNEDAFAFMDGLVGEGAAMYNCAGSLFGGKRLFITAKLPEDMMVGGFDKVEKYLVACTSHDGTLSLHIKWTPIRVVCWNTLSAAFGVGDGNQVRRDADMVSIRHTRNYKERLNEARRILGLTEVYYKRLGECFDRLLATPMSVKEFDSFTTVIVPEPKEGVNRTRTLNIRADLHRLYAKGLGLDANTRNSRWGAYNAVTEYVDHHRTSKVGKKNENDADSVHVNSVIWVSGSDLKKKALNLLVASIA